MWQRRCGSSTASNWPLMRHGSHWLPPWLPAYRVVRQGKAPHSNRFWQPSTDASGVTLLLPPPGNPESAEGECTAQVRRPPGRSHRGADRHDAASRFRRAPIPGRSRRGSTTAPLAREQERPCAGFQARPATAHTAAARTDFGPICPQRKPQAILPHPISNLSPPHHFQVSLCLG
jgi:hypothetical protein